AQVLEKFDRSFDSVSAFNWLSLTSLSKNLSSASVFGSTEEALLKLARAELAATGSGSRDVSLDAAIVSAARSLKVHKVAPILEHILTSMGKSVRSDHLDSIFGSDFEPVPVSDYPKHL